MTITPGVYGQIVILGILYTRPDFDPETGEYLSEPELLDGWHVNIPKPVPSSLEQYEVTPTNPQNVYAGDAENTVFLKFENEEQGLNLLISEGLLVIDND